MVKTKPTKDKKNYRQIHWLMKDAIYRQLLTRKPHSECIKPVLSEIASELASSIGRLVNLNISLKRKAKT